MEKKEQMYEGKAKKVFATENPDYCIVSYKDDATAFNGEKKGTIVGKGVVNNRMSNFMFKLLEAKGVPTDYVEELNDRETVLKKVEIVPLEVIIRNKAAGSFSKRFGVPEGTALKCPTLEFCLKDDALGDPMINDSQIYAIGAATKEEIAKINNRAEKEGIRLINIPIRHLGTEKSHEVYERLEKYIENNGIEMMFKTTVADLIVENGTIKGVKVKESKYVDDAKYPTQDIYSDNVVLAVGRKGANWLVDMANKHGIETETGIVDIGVRYELPDEVMKDVNKYMYEAKFTGRVGPFRDKVRTFCQNPSGFVSAEVYDNNLTLVNGHSYKERKSTNTNLAILVSHHFTSPFKRPIEYGRNVAQNLNDLGAGNIVVQRLGDIYRGKRTWDYELARNTVEPTLKSAVAGDITFALGYRTMVSILEFIRAVDKIVEGFGAPDNLLYAPEIKFYSNKVTINKQFETNIKGLYSIGDGGGMTRGLMMASCSGIQMARNL